jgi:hypothetical protein
MTPFKGSERDTELNEKFGVGRFLIETSRNRLFLLLLCRFFLGF